MLYIYPRVGNVCDTLCVNVLSQKYQTESHIILHKHDLLLRFTGISSLMYAHIFI